LDERHAHGHEDDHADGACSCAAQKIKQADALKGARIRTEQEHKHGRQVVRLLGRAFNLEVKVDTRTQILGEILGLRASESTGQKEEARAR
jgi:hypothetical protein